MSAVEHCNTDFIGFIGATQCHSIHSSSQEHHFSYFAGKGSKGDASKAEAAARKKEIAACKANCKVPYKEGKNQCKTTFKNCKDPVKQQFKDCKSGCKKSGLNIPEIFVLSTILTPRSPLDSFL
jgi:hypothetical protein